MTVKITGLQLKHFWKDPIWGDAYVEDELIRVDGKPWEGDPEQVPDEARVEVEGGYLVNHASEELEQLLKTWLRTTTHVVLMVEAPRDRVDDLKAAIKNAGGKLVTP